MTRPRRDPRAERAASAIAGAIRPRFALDAARGRGRPRRDPRADALSQQVPSLKRLRLDRSSRTAPRVNPTDQPRPIEEIVSAPIVIDDPAFLVAVVPDAPDGRLTVHDRQLFGAARTLAGGTGAVIAFVQEGCEGLGEAGADRACVVCDAAGDDDDPDRTVTAIADAVMALSPRHVLFAETPRGGDLARRLTVSMDESLFCDVEVVSTSSLARPARGRRIEQRSGPTRFITLAVDAAAPYAGALREGRPESFEASGTAIPASAIITAETIAADPASVPLALADFVTAAGNGIQDFETFHRLVAALRATPGASRVLCDAGVMPRDAQVGASGTVLAATCYFALGIAGAPQHLQGVAGCEHVVAVNTDLHAAMIERAGLAIVQDAQLVMPALLAELAREFAEAE